MSADGAAAAQARPELSSLAQLAERLGLRVSRLQRWSHLPGFPAPAWQDPAYRVHRPNGVRVYFVAEVLAWVSRRLSAA